MKIFNLNIQRWLRMSLLTIISCSICIILYPAFNFLSNKILNLVPAQHPIVGIFIIWLIFSTLCCFILIRLGGFRFHDFWSINSLYYPPTWLFALISASLYFLFTPIIWKLPQANQFSIEMLFFIIIALISALIIADLLSLILSSWEKYFASPKNIVISQSGPKDLKSILQEPDAFIKWLEEEKPIDDPSKDLFDLSVFARHLIRIFQSSPLKTIAIIGDYGCGKSSILKMTDFFLHNPKNISNEKQNEILFDPAKIIHCKVSGWGLQKGAAAEHILNSAIKNLSDHVDCLGLIGIPAHYRSALSNSGFGWSKAFAAITCSSEDTLESLKQMDTVLKCIRQRMVIFLEDLDRNTFDKPYWDEIISLLDKLKDLDNVSFVLAINQKNVQENVVLRIAEHTEYVPFLSKASVIESIVKYRDICLNITNGTDIDFFSKKERDELLGIKKTSQEYDIAEMLGLEVKTPIEAIAKLLNNPRLLKYTLRRTWHIWQSLHGEIDFDTLLVNRVIHTVAPAVYTYINENISQIRQLAYEDHNSQYTRERIEKISTKLHSELHQIIPDNLDINTLTILVQFLFPGWVKDDFFRIKTPQGVFAKGPTDYWIRLNREEILENEIRDQTVLYAVKNWKIDHMKDIYDGLNLSQALLIIDGFAEKVEQFGLLIDGQEVRELAEQLFANIRREDNRKKTIDQQNGFLNLWRLSLDKPIEGHEQWVVGELRKALSKRLQFANDIYYYWRLQNRAFGNAKEQTPFVRNEYIKAAKEIFGNNSQTLIDAIDSIQIYSIRHLMIYYSEPDGGGPGFKTDEWQWLAGVLLDAGIKKPQIIVPQIAALVVDSENLFRENKTVYSLNNKRLEELFTTNTHDVMRLLSTEIDYAKFDSHGKEIIQFARVEAQRWINKKENILKSN